MIWLEVRYHDDSKVIFTIGVLHIHSSNCWILLRVLPNLMIYRHFDDSVISYVNPSWLAPGLATILGSVRIYTWYLTGIHNVFCLLVGTLNVKPNMDIEIFVEQLCPHIIRDDILETTYIQTVVFFRQTLAWLVLLNVECIWLKFWNITHLHTRKQRRSVGYG